MGSSQSESKSQYVIEGINERSSVSEMISILRQSFQEKEYDEVERLIIMRENEMLTELKDIKKDFDSLRGEHDSLKRNYSRTPLDKIKLEQELLDCKSHLNKLKVTCEELCRGANSADAQYKCLAEELKRVELERESNLAKMIEELAKKDEELNKVKEEKEKALGEMTEKLAKKDGEINQLRTERENILEELTDKVLFLEEDITKELGVGAMHVGDPFSPAMESSDHRGSCNGVDSVVVGENGGCEVEALQVESENGGVGVEKTPNGSKEYLEMATLDTLPVVPVDVLPTSDSSRNARGAESPDFPLEDEHRNGDTHASSPEKTSSAAAALPSTNVPIDNQPLSAPKIIEISDSEDEGPVARGGSTFRAKRGRSTSDSDDSSCFLVDRGEVQDTDQSKRDRTWFDFMIEKEKKMQKKGRELMLD